MLRDLVTEGKSLNNVINMGKNIQLQKKVPGQGDVDWSVVDIIMKTKLKDAEQEVKMLRRTKLQIKTDLKVQERFTKENIININNARHKATNS